MDHSDHLNADVSHQYPSLCAGSLHLLRYLLCEAVVWRLWKQYLQSGCCGKSHRLCDLHGGNDGCHHLSNTDNRYRERV